MGGLSGKDAVTRRGTSRLLASLRGYQRAWLGADAAAALSLLVIAVPEQLATSRLAGMPLVTGYYAFAAGTVAFALLGSNPQLSVGADSTIAPLFAVGIGELAASGSPRYVAVVGVLALAVGVVTAIVALLRLGWIAQLLSVPIVTGFLAGIAVTIVVHQLPGLLGIPGGTGPTVHRIEVLYRHLGRIDGWTLGIGLAVLAVVVVSEALDRRIPGPLIGLVGSTVAVAALGLRHDGVAVIGSFPHGPPHLGLAALSWSTLRKILPLAGVVSLVVVTQTAATSRAFADRGGYDIDASRDFLGVAAGNLLAGAVGAFPVDASPPRTAAVAQAGGRTQLAGLGAAVALVALVPAAGLLRDLPVATLSAVLIVVAGRLLHVRDLVSIARFDAFEAALATVTMLAVTFIGVQQGIGVAVALAILDRTRLSARPRLHVLGQIPGTTSWVPLSSPQQVSETPGVLVVLFAAPLWYANAVQFRSEVMEALAAERQLRALVLDALGMSDIDFTGSRALRQVLDKLDKAQVTFALARANSHVRTSLARSGLLQRIGEDRLFPSVGEAVAAVVGRAQAASPVPSGVDGA
jgi:SulP family sulfate permease